MRLIARILSIFVGAIALGFVFYKLIGPVGHWYELNFAKNDGDLGQAYMVALAVQLVALIAGGWLGDWVFRKWRQKQLDRQ
jgi:membrane associated rhomboid family serine protease